MVVQEFNCFVLSGSTLSENEIAVAGRQLLEGLVFLQVTGGIYGDLGIFPLSENRRMEFKFPTFLMRIS